MDSLDTSIFQFVPRLKEHKAPISEDTAIPMLKGSERIIDLGPVSNLAYTTINPDDHSLTSKYIDVNGTMIGLNDEDFRDLKGLLEPLLEQTIFGRYADIGFLVENTFDWIIEVYRLQKATMNLIPFLSERLDAVLKDYHFYFRIRPVEIEEKLVIGEGEIGYFRSEMIEEYYRNFVQVKPGTTFQAFQKLYGDHFTGIHVHLKIKGVPERAEALARRKAEQIVDVLKCFCVDYGIQDYYQVFDLDYRLPANGAASILRLADGKIEKSEMLFRNVDRMVPIQLTKLEVEKFNVRGLSEFSNFLVHIEMNELSELILNSIHLLSTIISTPNPYEKVVKAISFIENIVIPKDAQGKAKGLTRVKKIIPQITSNQIDIDRITGAIFRAYTIRDKYLHNYVQLPLEKETLFYLMEFERAVVLKLIRLSKRYTTISEIYQIFGID
jgi:hypothetical protein